jgi:hypothetical protein
MAPLPYLQDRRDILALKDCSFIRDLYTSMQPVNNRQFIAMTTKIL